MNVQCTVQTTCVKFYTDFTANSEREREREINIDVTSVTTTLFHME